MPDDIAPNGAPTVEPVTLVTADGLTLEGELAMPADPAAAVLLAHPHPQHGGSMRSLVTSELFGLLPGGAAGPPLAALRFNFRGVEGSEGSYGEGRGEGADIVAALDVLSERARYLPIVVAGWSFGADVSLSVVDGRIAAWCPVAPPLRILPAADFVAAHDPRPKRLLVPERDQFDPPDTARRRTEGWNATTIEVISGADHFCVGRTREVAERVAGFATQIG